MERKEAALTMEAKPRFKILFLNPTSSSKWHGPDYLLVSRQMDFDKRGLKSFEHMVISRIKIADQVVEGKKLKLLPLPETPRDYAAIIITGSPYTVRGEIFEKRGKWIRETKEFLRQAIKDEIPVLGICFGAQILARALGGNLERIKPQEVGCIKIFRRSASRDDPLFGNLPSEFYAQVNHTDFVTRLPSNAVLLAEGQRGVQAFRIGSCAWGVLFHPEREVDITRVYLEENRGKLKKKGLNPDQLIAQLRPTPTAQRILSNFFNFVLTKTS